MHQRFRMTLESQPNEPIRFKVYRVRLDAPYTDDPDPADCLLGTVTVGDVTDTNDFDQRGAITPEERDSMWMLTDTVIMAIDNGEEFPTTFEVAL